MKGNRFPVTAYLSKEVYEKLENARGRIKRATYAEDLISKGLEGN